MRRGMGVVANPDGSFYVPGWCDWLPFSSFNDACKLPTPQQVLADQMLNLGGAAKNNPSLVAALQQKWSQTDTQQCAANPELCSEYAYGVDNPTLSAAIGTGPAARAAIDLANIGLPSWLWIGGAVLVGVTASLSLIKLVER